MNAGVVSVLQDLTIWSDHQNNLFVVPITAREGATVADVRRRCEAEKMTLLGVRGHKGVEINPDGARPIARGEAAVVVSATRPSSIGA
jgi:hypothetical protein